MKEKTTKQDSAGAVAIDTVRQVALEFAGIGLIRVHTNGEIDFLDRTALRVLGIEEKFPFPQDAKGYKLKDLIGPSPLDGLLAEPGILRAREVTFTPPGGTAKTVILDIYFVRLQDSGEELAQGLIREAVVTNVSDDERHAKLVEANERIQKVQTEREEALEALTHSEERYRTTIDSMRDAIHLIDEDLTIIYWNRAFRRWAKDYDLQIEAEGKNVFEIFPFLPDKVRQEYERVFAEGKVVITEEMTELDGLRIATESRKIPVFENGKVVRVVTVIRDITGRTEAQEEIMRLNLDLEKLVAKRTHQLEVANSELEAFASSVSHDLRSPLTTLKGFCQAFNAIYSAKLDDKGKSFLKRMDQAVDKMDSLISDLLALSRVNKTELEISELSLTKLASEVIAELWAGDPNHNIDVDIAKNLKCNGDGRLLKVLLENLLGNAWKFSHKSEQAKIEMGQIKGTEDSPIFFVRDNGAGFPMTEAEKLFVPFERLHRPKDFPGTGVGLATVRRIVERHGGRIWAEGGVDEGATFYFTL